MVSTERSLREVTITGLCTVKEPVRFYDPVNGQPENIAITKELKRSVRFAHTTYQALRKAEKLEDERKREEADQKKEAEGIQKAKEEMVKSRQSLQDSEDTLMWEEEVVKADIKAAYELMNDATSKQHDALSATAAQQTVDVATMVLDTGHWARR